MSQLPVKRKQQPRKNDLSVCISRHGRWLLYWKLV